MSISETLLSYPNGLGFFILLGVAIFIGAIITIIWQVIIPLFKKEKKETVIENGY